MKHQPVGVRVWGGVEAKKSRRGGGQDEESRALQGNHYRVGAPYWPPAVTGDTYWSYRVHEQSFPTLTILLGSARVDMGMGEGAWVGGLRGRRFWWRRTMASLWTGIQGVPCCIEVECLNLN